MKNTIILAVESSCDETAIALIRNGNDVLSNIVSSQIDTHVLYGGVIPEVASRLHIENITVVLKEALKDASINPSEIDAVAFTQGPGLIGSLHVGVQAAKAIALALDKPLVPVHHIAGHIYANRFVSELTYPLLSLVVSGGHTELVYMKEDFDFTVLGRTGDDAIGEAFDKVARVMGLGYPGGPKIDKLAKEGHHQYDFPKVKTENPLDFSFSGLKSSVIQTLDRERRNLREINPANLAFDFQEACLNQLVSRVKAALDTYEVKMLTLAGGVAANSRLRELITGLNISYPEITIVIPPMWCCTDNAAMIGAVGYAAFNKGIRGNWSVSADSNLIL